MAKLSANGTEIIRLERTAPDSVLGNITTTLSFRSNGWVLRKRHIKGVTRGTWKRASRFRPEHRNEAAILKSAHGLVERFSRAPHPFTEVK